jgi:acetyl esterase/lipase
LVDELKMKFFLERTTREQSFFFTTHPATGNDSPLQALYPAENLSMTISQANLASIIGVVVIAVAASAVARPAVSRPLPPGARLESNIPYGSDPAQRMDVYIPEHAKKAPVILMVHGGGWRRGDKAYPGVTTNKVAHWLPEGYIIITINYPLLPQANPLQQAGDVAKALAYAQDHARSWGADPTRFILMGHSAGAHLVSLVTADPAIAARQGAKPWLGTVSLDSAAYNVVKIMEARHFKLYDEAFGTDHKLWEAASPTLCLKTKTVPMLLVCSTRRRDSQAQAKALADKAKSLGGQATLLPVDMTHGPINSQLGLPGDYTNKVDAFIHALVAPPPSARGE